MSEKVSLKITSSIAACVREGTPRDVKLQAARRLLPLSSGEQGTVLIILSQDRDPEIKGAAIQSLRDLPQTVALEIVADFDTHPRVLDILARLHYVKPAVVEKLLAHPGIPQATRLFLAGKVAALPPGTALPAQPRQSALVAAPDAKDETAGNEADVDILADDDVAESDSEEVIDEESEEFQSKYQLAQSMAVGDKIKTALTGDKEWRSLLIKDSNKLVSGSVVKNPRITEGEILTIAKSVIQNEEILRVICLNKEWLKNYQIRKALALNNKTPLPKALRFLATLIEKDLSAIGKSKNVSSVLASSARRIISAKVKK